MITVTEKATRSILLVEDNPEDFEATHRSLRKAGMANPIFHCEDGDDALDFLYQRGRYTNSDEAPRPSVVLLDLNMPGTDGVEVLKEVKSNPNLRSIPIIVLTTSSDERDIEACYAAGANSYIQKPVDLKGFVQAIQRLKNYWFEITILPKA